MEEGSSNIILLPSHFRYVQVLLYTVLACSSCCRCCCYFQFVLLFTVLLTIFLFYFHKLYVIINHSWMKVNRLSKKYENGLIQFLDFTEKYFPKGVFWCPLENTLLLKNI